MNLIQEFLLRVVEYFSNNFELLLALNLAFFVIFFIALMAVKIKEVASPQYLRTKSKNFLFSLGVTSQVFLLVLIGYAYWMNYISPVELMVFPEDVSSHTHWVKEATTVYFVEEGDLYSVRVNGRSRRKIFFTGDSIKEYHFSPDGHWMLVLTEKELYLLDPRIRHSELIDSVKELEKEEGLKGVISDIRWSPDSDHFCYEKMRWSKYSSQKSVYIYDRKEKSRETIKDLSRRVSSLYWDEQGENLYYLRHEATQTALDSYPFEVKVFRIPLTTLSPEFVVSIPHEKSSVPMESLNLREINLFMEGDKNSFNIFTTKENLISDQGTSLGVDENDFLYFVKDQWFRKRLFKVSRRPVQSDVPRYQYQGGELSVQNIRWLPRGRYALMEHKGLGVLIIDPLTHQAGWFPEVKPDALGWYQDVRPPQKR